MLLTLSLVGSHPSFRDSRPRFGVAPADAFSVDPSELLASMTVIPGGYLRGRAGSFTLQTTAGNYGWLAIEAGVTENGLRIFDGVGYGGWSGADLPGDNTGSSPDPTISAITWVSRSHVEWRFFRQDYVNADPTPHLYTIS